MEPILERGESAARRSQQSQVNHPLLEPKVLTTLFAYLSPSELKAARLVCPIWNSAATPILMRRTVVNLQGTCAICNSSFHNDRQSTKSQHDHRRTISFYRFVSLLQVLYPRDREKIHFENFRISDINLYLLPKVHTEPTKYFQMFVRLFGEKVKELYFHNVQICPSESVTDLVLMFKNLESVHFEQSSLWMDPAEKNPPPPLKDVKMEVKRPLLVDEWWPHIFLKSLSLGPEVLTEKWLNWADVFDKLPGLNALSLRDFTREEIDKCLETLGNMPQERFKQLAIRKLVIYPRGHSIPKPKGKIYRRKESSESSESFVPEVATTPIPDATEVLQGDRKLLRRKHPSSESETDVGSSGSSTAPVPASASTFKLLATAVKKLHNLEDLTLKIGYTSEDSELLPLFEACCDRLTSLTLERPSNVVGPEKRLFFMHGLFETPKENPVVFPHVKTLSVAHNFIHNFDELRQSFPALEILKFNIAVTEVLLRDKKPYHTYLRTNSVTTLRTCGAFKYLRELTWDNDAARHKRTKFRTVVYKTNAFKYAGAAFPYLTKLKVSITRGADLALIFQQLLLLEDLSVLKNSLYRTKDKEIVGDDEVRVKGQRIRSGIRQLKHLQRLSLENNNCCLTNESIRRGFVKLKQLRSLTVNNGTQLNMRGLRLLHNCDYLAFVKVTKASKSGVTIDLEEAAPPSPPLLPALITLPEKYKFRSKSKIPKNINPPKRVILKSLRPQKAPVPILRNISRKGSLPILISTSTLPIDEGTESLKPAEVKSFGRLHSPSLLSLPPILPMDNETGKVDYKTALLADEDFDVKQILSMHETDPAKAQLERFILEKSRRSPLGHIKAPRNKIPFSQKKPPGYRRRVSSANGTKTKLKKYETTSTLEKIGGRKYGFVKTFYQVNGRTYQLVRRRYETDKEKEKHTENYKIWKRRKRNGFVPELELEIKDDDAILEPVRESDAEGSESEYEHSVKDYDEDEADSEEYVEDEFERENFRVKMPSESDSYETDSDKSEPAYEADREFQDGRVSTSDTVRTPAGPRPSGGRRLRFAPEVLTPRSSKGQVGVAAIQPTKVHAETKIPRSSKTHPKTVGSKVMPPVVAPMKHVCQRRSACCVGGPAVPLKSTLPRLDSPVLPPLPMPPILPPFILELEPSSSSGESSGIAAELDLAIRRDIRSPLLSASQYLDGVRRLYSPNPLAFEAVRMPSGRVSSSTVLCLPEPEPVDYLLEHVIDESSCSEDSEDSDQVSDDSEPFWPEEWPEAEPVMEIPTDSCSCGGIKCKC